MSRLSVNPSGERLKSLFQIMVVALIASAFGCGGMAAAASGTAQLLFFAFSSLLAISLFFAVVGRDGDTSS